MRNNTAIGAVYKENTRYSIPNLTHTKKKKNRKNKVKKNVLMDAIQNLGCRAPR